MKVKVSILQTVEVNISKKNLAPFEALIREHTMRGPASDKDYDDARAVITSAVGLPFDDDETKGDAKKTIIAVYDLEDNPIIEV